MGFDRERLVGILAAARRWGGEEAGETLAASPGQAEVLQEKYQVEVGQVWRLGRHWLMCGDCRETAVWERLLGEETADLLLADTPYGKLTAFNAKGAIGSGGDNVAQVKNYGEYEGHKVFDIRPMIEALNGARGQPRRYDKAIIRGGNYFTDVLPVSSSWLVWDKRAAEEGQNLFYADCELAWSDLGCTAKVFRYVWQGMIRQGERIERVHPTQKPVPLYEWCLSLCPEARTVLDPTAGSGSSLLAAENMNVTWYGCELMPVHVAAILERWQNSTGKRPELVA